MLEVLRFIYRNLDNFKTRFALVFIAGLIYGSFSFSVALTLAEFTKNDFTVQKFYTLVPVLLLVYTGYLSFAWVIRKYGESLGPQFENYVRFKYFRRLEALPVGHINKLHSGYVLSLINRIGAGLNQVMFNTFWSATSGLAQTVLFFVFIAQKSISLAFINLGILLLFVSVSTYLAQKMVGFNRELSLRNASLLESYADFITNLITIKKLAIYSFAENRLSEKTSSNYDQIYTVQRFHAKRWLFLHSLFGLAFMGTIIYFLYEIALGRESLAILILFISAFGAIRFHMERLSESLKVIIETKAYISSLEEILSGDKELVGKNTEKEWRFIKFNNVEFTFVGNNKTISIPDFTLRKGEKLCIEGVSGQGKSTLLNLLINSFPPQKGEISVDDVSYSKLPRNFFDAAMVMISQEVDMFNLSLRENIVLGKKISEEKILQLLKQIDLLTWVEHLQQGLETIVGEKGVRLSAGQKQRINLMRGLLLERDIYLLDEPTSHLDNATEQKVIEFLRHRLEGKTAVIVTHRPVLQQLCDRRYLFKNHKVTEIL